MPLFPRIIKYVWPHMRKNQGAFYSVIILFIIRITVGFTVIPYVFKKIIDLVSASDQARALIVHDLVILVSVIIGLELVVAVSARTRQYIYDRYIAGVIKNLRDFSLKKIEQNSLNFFINTFAGSLVTKSRRFVNAFEGMVEILIFNILQVVTILVGTFVVLLFESSLLALLFFGSLAIYLSIVLMLLKTKITYDQLEAEQDSRISGRLADIYANISAVKFFSARQSELISFGEYTDEGKRRTLQAAFWNRRIEMVQSISSSTIYSLITCTTIYLWVNYQISTGTVVLVQTYVTMTLFRIWDLVMSLTRFMKGASDMKEMLDVFDTIPEVIDSDHPEKIRIDKGHILFDQVGFKYKKGNEILRDFNLEIKPGERVGLVGHSGAGKSTITSLMLRFMDVEAGSVKIDGQNIKNVTQEDLRSVISFVPQESVLFHRSIRENIAYAKPAASNDEIIEVAKKAHAHEFISALPYGYDTLVGERGVKLSGGERQRVAIARAMLKNAPILVLDEATSSLDSVSEHYIQDAFSELMKNKTTIVIAHRLSTIQKMDRIIVLDKGKIVEEGTHSALLKKGGVYKDLWDHQVGGFLE